MNKFLEYYQRLVEEAESITDENINKQIWTSINRLPTKYTEFIYFIILHHYLTENGSASLPYFCKIQPGGRGVIFNVDNIPLELQKIILAYLVRISK